MDYISIRNTSHSCLCWTDEGYSWQGVDCYLHLFAPLILDVEVIAMKQSACQVRWYGVACRGGVYLCSYDFRLVSLISVKSAKNFLTGFVSDCVSVKSEFVWLSSFLSITNDFPSKPSSYWTRFDHCCLGFEPPLIKACAQCLRIPHLPHFLL